MRRLNLKPNLNNNIHVNIMNGVALAIATNLVNPYYAKFALRLGATDYQLAFLNSWPAFVSIFALIPGALILETMGSKSKGTARAMLLHKFFFLFLAVIPFLNTLPKPWLFVGLVGLMNFPGSIYTMGYQSCIGDIFDAAGRATAMSLRNKYSDLFRLLITFASGQLLIRVPTNDSEVIIMYQVFFVVAFIFGIMEYKTFKHFKLKNDMETPVFKRQFHIALKSGFSYIKSSRSFKLFFMCSLIFHFGWQMGWPLFNIYMINVLGANEGWLSAVSIASGLSAILTATTWGKFADKYGNTLAIVIATSGMSITPILYVFSESLVMLVVFNILIGVSITGTVLVLFNMLLDVTPSTNRTTIISIYNTVIAISATVAPILGVSLMERTSLKTALIIVGLLRFLGSGSFYIRRKIMTRSA
ncbi:MFS transporter [Fusibacter tunisiensis]|uniref:MFS family permease n=1 Tax=Fusibacter tunisiensis TaxID=1008308 RepID=A0ABS2MTF7_9FIRM|nr:MFS transporter [Fusibacter tunisiensis]MBM7562696.1 MFS family permease [Fusibacter tunisiensis]